MSSSYPSADKLTYEVFGENAAFAVSCMICRYRTQADRHTNTLSPLLLPGDTQGSALKDSPNNSSLIQGDDSFARLIGHGCMISPKNMNRKRRGVYRDRFSIDSRNVPCM